MKIVYVGNFSQSHCTEVHLAATLEKLGHEVIRFQERPNATGVTLISETADLFLWTRTLDLSAGKQVMEAVLDKYKNLGIPTASYHLDLYIGLNRADGLDDDPFWRTDYVFTPDGDPASAEVFKAKGINHIYMKPGVYEPECKIFNQSPIEQTQESLRRHPKVLFVGGGDITGSPHVYGHKEWPYRGELIKWLYATYGHDFSKFGWPQETVRNAELNQLYADARVVVGDSLCLNFNHPYYWSDRVYETLGRGGFIIHPYIKGMEEEFADGENIVFYEYNNWDQLKEKIQYYLDNPEERERIRRAGHEFVKNNATYTHRLEQMLRLIGNAEGWLTTDTLAKAEAGLEAAGHTGSEDQYIDIPADSAAGAVPTPSPVAPSAGNVEQQTTIRPKKFVSLGAGTEIERGEEWVNVDIVPLKGIDKVHNLMHFPYPFEDGSVDYIKAKDLIEHLATHLPDGRNTIIAFIEECHRILRADGTLFIQTPAHDAPFLWIDPTHVRGFAEESFDFFDPETDFGRATGFYSEAKFKVNCNRLENGNLQFGMVKR